MDNKTCSELIGDELKKRIEDFEQALRSYEENNYEKMIEQMQHAHHAVHRRFHSPHSLLPSCSPCRRG